MFNYPGAEDDTVKICSMLSGREYGIASFIAKASEELEECVNSGSRFDGCKILKVSAEELSMIADFRRVKIEKARQELQEVRMIREQITCSLNEENQMVRSGE